MGLIETDLDETPPARRWRVSKYDYLIRYVDDKVVVLPRGEVAGFGESTPMAVIRAALGKWAKSRGLQVELRYLWEDYRTGEPSGFRIEGEEVPWGIFVKVRSEDGAGASTELLEQLAIYERRAS